MILTTRLLHWYDRHGRDLPWRGTRDPYRILVSEIMLQQTQVPRVLLFYTKWLRRFPSWKILAQASNADVIRAWAGLGYNRRALMLRDIARHVIECGVPKNEKEWLNLKGIGPYTAAALAAFSLHHQTFPIDTNIRRVAGRLLLGRPFPSPSDDDRLRHLATRLLASSPTRSFDVPQALFDLANANCAKRPACITCPMIKHCLAAKKFLSGSVRVPKRTTIKANETIHPGKKYPDRIYRGRILKRVRETSQGISLQALGHLIDPT
ncbi:MAG: A/G-specific adenine glycosylase, partial [Candidatus Uhrbacteria bacterium]|nr:A/G-specific adenine glycosylase [Candidatus Uhrbacteria bacterium]